jgi:hypothetical protein
VPPLIQQYDFGGQLRALQDPTALDPPKLVGPTPVGGAPAASTEVDGKVPKGYQPRTDVPLSSTGLEVVRVSETWRVGQNTPAAGQGEESTSVIVLKPQEPGLDTNLLVITDRRAYYLRIVSKPQEYVARVAFRYPDEDRSVKWQQHRVAQTAEAQERKRDGAWAKMTGRDGNPSSATGRRRETLLGGSEVVSP